MRVVVSNPTRLHAHRHAYALQKAGYLDRFLTSVWHKPKSFPYSYVEKLPKKIRRPIRAFLAKRSHLDLREDKVKQFFGAELYRLLMDVMPIGRSRDRMLLWQKLKYDRTIGRYIRKHKPDVFVGFEISCAKAFASAKDLGTITVLDLAGLEHDFSAGIRPEHAQVDEGLEAALRGQKKQELSLADAIICVSDLARQSLEKAGVPESAITVIHLGLDHSIFNAKGRVWERAGKPFRICYAGNLSQAKGVDTLIEAFKKANIPNSELCLAGSGADISHEAFSHPNIKRLSFLNAKALADLFRDSDVFVLPTFLDSWGMVVPEAMACGLPVITTDMCGASELISAENGRIFTAGDTNALAQKISDLYQSRHTLAVMGESAAKAVSILSWDAYNKNIKLFHERLARVTQ